MSLQAYRAIDTVMNTWTEAAREAPWHRAQQLSVEPSWVAESGEPYRDAAVMVDAPPLLSLSSGTTGETKGPSVTQARIAAR
jgi:hypothetical protein